LRKTAEELISYHLRYSEQEIIAAGRPEQNQPLLDRSILIGHPLTNRLPKFTLTIDTAEAMEHTMSQTDRSKCLASFTLLFQLALMIFLLSLATGPVLAQQSDKEGTETKALIERAQHILESKEIIPLGILNDVRQELANLRDSSREFVERGSVEGRTIRAQLDSLGPPPAEGFSESEEIAGRRSELRAELSNAEAPIRLTREVLQQAEVLIREIDQRIRNQQNTVLLHRFPTPLSPSAWLTAATELTVYSRHILAQTKNSLQQPGEIDRLRGNLPTVLALGAFGLAVLLVGRPVILHRLDQASTAGQARWFRWLLIALKNISRLALPAIGIAPLLLIINLLQLDSDSFVAITGALPWVAALIIIASWLGHTIFSPTNREERLLSLSDGHARTGYLLCLGFGLILALERLAEIVIQNYLFTEETISVMVSPLILCSCLLLWQMGRLLLLCDQGTGNLSQQGTEGEKQSLDSGFLYMLSRVMQGAALIVPLFLLLGFIKLSQEAVEAIVLTVMLLGLALLLYNIVVNILQALLATSQNEELKPLSLLPVCVICLLVIAFAPLLAMAWGASVTDLREIWRLLTDGVQLGEIRLSLDMVVTLVIVFTIGIFLTRWLQRLLRISVLPRTRLDRGAQTALVTGIGYVGLTLTALIAVSSAGLNLSNLAFVAGALSIGIGFGLQTIVSNFVSGIILLVERPIKEGDWIEVSGYSGVVRKISVRSTRIETFDRHDVVLPNSDLISGTVKNMTLSSMTGRLIIPVGVAYGSDLEKTREILLEAARNHNSVYSYPSPSVLFTGFGASSLDFELRCFLRDIGDILTVKSDLLFTIYAGLTRAGIEIPFSQHDINLRDIDRLVAAIQGRAEHPPTPVARSAEPDALRDSTEADQLSQVKTEPAPDFRQR
jgi:potassium-dependent mechanosensitive channel